MWGLTSELTPGLISRLVSAFNFGTNFEVRFGDQGTVAQMANNE